MYMMAMPCGTLLAAMTFKAYGASHQGFLEDLKRQFKGEYGVAPDRHDIFGYLSLAFFGHMLVHWACLKFWIIPVAQKHSEDEDPRESVRKELLKLADTPEEVFSMMGGTSERKISKDDFIKFIQEKEVRWQDTPKCRNESDVYSKFNVDDMDGLCLADLFPPEYEQLSKVEAANWLTTNPVYCLRSKYVYKDKIPCTFFRMGKDHLIRRNADIEQYFEGMKQSDEKVDEVDDAENTPSLTRAKRKIKTQLIQFTRGE
jgi:hypothetical protein